MPALIAAPWLGTAIAGVAAGTGAVVGAKMQSGAARDAANAQTTASNYAADRQTAAAEKAESFLRQQAQNAYLNDEAIRRANYEQWAAQQARYGSIGEHLGLGKRTIPGYVGGVDPRYMDVTTPPAGAGPPRSTTQPVPIVNGRSPAEQGQYGHLTRGGTVPLSIGSYLPPAAMRAPDEEGRRTAMYRGATPGSIGSYLRRNA